MPIITGIGHQRDDTVLDAVAHTRVKTPTAAAEILIHTMAVQAARIDNIRTNIVDGVRKAMSDARRRLQLVARSMPVATALFMQEHHHKLDMWQQLLQSASPENILAMGYTLTTCNGKPIRSVSDVGAGEIVVTHLADGSFESTVNKKNLNIKNNG